jgi:NADPH2:quinone reductase
MSSIQSNSSYQGIQLPKISKTIEEGINTLQLVNVPRASLEPNQVRISVYASCLNYYDLLILINRYQFKPSIPAIMGSEYSGKIIEVGSEVNNFKVGDAVMVGMTFDGSNAAECITNAQNCHKLPAGFSYLEGAAFPVGFYTGYHALVQRGNAKKGDWLLVSKSKPPQSQYFLSFALC